VLCSLEQEGGAAVISGHILSTNYVILWIWGAFKTTGNSKKKKRNHDDVSDLQVVAVERGPSSQFTIPSWMRVQNVFSQS
jgi:hypothetical protein